MLLKISVIVFFGVLLIACSSSKKIEQQQLIDISETDSLGGAALIRKNDCVTCHSISKKLIGPAFLNIANKYVSTSATIDKLSEKISKGGGGVWGDVPMVPHPSLSQNDTKTIVKYILSLKK